MHLLAYALIALIVVTLFGRGHPWQAIGFMALVATFVLLG